MEILKGFLEETGYDKNLPKTEIKRILATDKNLRDSYFTQTFGLNVLEGLTEVIGCLRDYKIPFIELIQLSEDAQTLSNADYYDESPKIKKAEISYQNNFKMIKETLESCEDKEVSTIIWEYISYLRKIKMGELPYVASFKAGRKK